MIWTKVKAGMKRKSKQSVKDMKRGGSVGRARASRMRR
jgi:hypothetical protein